MNLTDDFYKDIIFTEKVGLTLEGVLATDEMVARAAWVSMGADLVRERTDGSIRGVINFLMRENHTSPFEHSIFTFRADVPIFISRQMIRHRTASINEVSGRYTELEPRFYVPPRSRRTIQTGKVGAYQFVEATDEQKNTLYKHMAPAAAQAWRHYQAILADGHANEVARMVLPLNTMTQLYFTLDAHNLIKFIKARADAQAQQEIQWIADQMVPHLAHNMPLTYDAAARNGRL